MINPNDLNLILSSLTKIISICIPYSNLPFLIELSPAHLFPAGAASVTILLPPVAVIGPHQAKSSYFPRCFQSKQGRDCVIGGIFSDRDSY